MNKEEIIKLICDCKEIEFSETEEKIIIEIKKERKQTLEELGFSFEVGM